jgi:lysophospholipase L1-like esterase
MKLRGVICFLLLITFYSATTFAQKAVSLNYYSEETLKAIGASAEQKQKIKLIKSNTDTRVREIKADASLSEESKKDKYKEVYANASASYNDITSAEQKAIIRKLLKEISDKNIKSGIAPKIDSNFKNPHYDGRMELFESLPKVNNAIVFLGNSITERGAWQELIPGKIISNRGIGGDNTFGVLARLDDIIKSKPEKLFLMIGVNDLASRGWPVDLVFKNYNRIVNRILEESPKTKLYIQSVLPINDDIITIERFKGRGIYITEFNKKLQQLAIDKKLVYVNVHDQFTDSNGKLKANFTNDGIHLKPKAYTVWVNYLKENKHL